MEVRVIPVLEHNYVCLVIEEHTREAVPVDMAMPKSIVGREGGSLTTVLTMHHHWDNAELARLRPGLVVLGADECLCTLTHAQAPCEKLRAGAQTRCDKDLWLFQKDEEAMPTVRSTLAQELLYNPFLGVASWAFLWGRLGAYGRA
ncbi:hydroxyacylglutathione hydrolase like [Rhinolophus ferrumequinum]|uniref:Hydroxyacylglutathione hydrolase like n=1 Tax=Rhinolophus ferrumequinum TaxID=59479 RepID=A0A7J7R5R2_RHIFE|nr:hydroxyacylglutathione hydrolase like [Rhinolophus ferrumequinum]